MNRNRAPRSLWAAVTTALTVAALAAIGTTQALHTASADDDPAGAAVRQETPAHPATNTQERPTPHSGSRGQAVVELQQRLTAHGHALTPDGTFGPRTQAAVTVFQTHHGLPADGIVGPRTWKALLAGPPSVKRTAPRPATYTLKFTKNWNDPQNSRLALLRDGKVVVSYRAGSGKDFSRNECTSSTGWLPSGTYRIEGHTTSRGADAMPWNEPAVQGYVIGLADKVCKPVSGQKAVNRTDLFIHSEMEADGTQGFSVFEEDSLRRWEGDGDYKSSGCIKLHPDHVKDLFRRLDRAGWPKDLTLQVN
ncbi:peptidoglycan-binding protein [Streptomyces sp. NPDC051740]|uniref:L,D-transpeptidase family protein n=1 Tax=Streptomyces sp. NPDC051740 TaxID=3365673 RepID=UPI0037AF642A